MGRGTGPSRKAAPAPVDIPTLSVDTVRALSVLPSVVVGLGKDRETIKAGCCIYSLPEGEPVNSAKRHDGHQLDIKAVISVHQGPDRVWLLCRDLYHTSHALLTDQVVADKKDFFGKGELIATEEQSVVQTSRIVSTVEVHILDVALPDVPEIPANGWWIRYMVHGGTLKGLTGTLANPAPALIPAGLACCDKPYCPNDVKGQSVYCPNCEHWLHISCEYGGTGAQEDGDSDDSGRWEGKGSRPEYKPQTLIDNLKSSPIIRGAFYRVGNDPPCYREDWMLGGSGHQILRFRETLKTNKTRLTTHKVKGLFGHDQLLRDLEELDLAEMECPCCKTSI